MRPSRILFVLAVMGCLVLLNILGLRAFRRVDLTRDRMYTLSQATRDALGHLEDPVTISAYFSENLPPPHAQNARYVRDLLEEYRAASHGKLAFEFVDPTRQESAEDKEKKKQVKRDIFGGEYREQTQVEKDLAAKGLEPVKLKVVQEDQQQVKLVYMGLLLRYLDKQEVIPVVNTTESLEYELTSLIRKMTRKKAPVLALAAPQAAGAEGQESPYETLKKLFSEQYDVRPLNLDAATEIPGDTDALFVLGPDKKIEEPVQKAIDAFLLRGKSAAFFLDLAKPDPRSFSVTPVDHGLGPLLSTYGVKLGESLVADVECAQLTVQEQRGFMRIGVPVHYPFIPLVARMEGDSVLSRGLTHLNFPFVGALSLEPRDGLQEQVLARSSPRSWLETKPFNTDPRRDWRDTSPSFGGPYPLLVEVNGKLKSHFGGQAGSGESRVIVAQSASLAADTFMGPTNQALMLNVADFLILDPGMLAMRSRGLSEPPLKSSLSDGTRNWAKWGNALGIPLLLSCLGLFRWRWRERRRAAMTV